MGALTHASLVEYLLEEAYEVAETVEAGARGDSTADAELQGELGDVLLQVVLHARLAEERGAFTFDDVARGLAAKMIRRNPHVFRPDGSLQDSFPATVDEIVQNWDAVKRTEMPERTSPFEGIPQALPALLQEFQQCRVSGRCLQRRAAVTAARLGRCRLAPEKRVQQPGGAVRAEAGLARPHAQAQVATQVVEHQRPRLP